MLDEYYVLITNGTWVLVPRLANVNIVRSIWLLKHKHHAYGSLSRYKARLVANGRSQQKDIDCHETFSLVVKPATIRAVVSINVSRSWPIHQLDVKNSFLYGHLSKTVYMHQPPGFVDPQRPDYVCHLQHSLYSLKQARVLGSSISSSSAFLHRVIALLHGEFAMTGLGSLTYFLGISAQRLSAGLFLSQSTYAKEILERAHTQKSNPYRTLLDIKSKLGADVQHVCLYMHDPREPHLAALKRILRYVRITIDNGI
nr:hypothetical protein [Tanacetum cinerariifolium]